MYRSGIPPNGTAWQSGYLCGNWVSTFCIDVSSPPVCTPHVMAVSTTGQTLFPVLYTDELTTLHTSPQSMVDDKWQGRGLVFRIVKLMRSLLKNNVDFKHLDIFFSWINQCVFITPGVLSLDTHNKA